MTVILLQQHQLKACQELDRNNSMSILTLWSASMFVFSPSLRRSVVQQCIPKSATIADINTDTWLLILDEYVFCTYFALIVFSVPQ